MIPAIKKDLDLVKEMDEKVSDHNHYYIWWLGQSGFLLQWQGKRVLLDPYLSDSLTIKYAQTDKPHIRMSERVVDPELLRGIRIVSSSHNHTDHLDGETLKPVLQNNPGIHFIIPEANRDFVKERTGCQRDFPVGLNDGDSVEFDGFRFLGIPASHNNIERDELGRCRFMGYVISFGNKKIYHSGDTLWFPELENILLPLNVDLALLPINGNIPERKVAGNMNGTEVVKLAGAARIKRVIPCHYDMFTFNTADPMEFARLAKAAEIPYTLLKPGEYYKEAYP